MSSKTQRDEDIDKESVTKSTALDSFDDLKMEFVLSALNVQLIFDACADCGNGYLNDEFESLPKEKQRQIIKDSFMDVEDQLNNIWFELLENALELHTRVTIENQKEQNVPSLDNESRGVQNTSK